MQEAISAEALKLKGIDNAAAAVAQILEFQSNKALVMYM